MKSLQQVARGFLSPSTLKLVNRLSRSIPVGLKLLYVLDLQAYQPSEREKRLWFR